MCLASDLEYLSSAILASKDSESLSAEESEPLPQDLGEASSCAHKKQKFKISTRSRLPRPERKIKKIPQTELKMGKARAARAQRKDWLCPNPILGPILASCLPREPKKATFLMRALSGFPTSTWTTILALNGRRPSPLEGNLRAESPVSLWAPLPPLLTRGPR
jgi:hypothetical protein